MRLQLTLFFLFLNLFVVKGQSQDTVYLEKGDVEIDFLMSYYEQDGIHSAVTGGRGSEELTDIASMLVVNIPLDSVKTLHLKGGLTYYTSASNDNIDFRRSSASEKEFRGDLDVEWSKYHPLKGTTRRYGFGLSIDVDYFSSSVGYSWSKLWPQQDRQLDIGGRFYYDIWVWLVYPSEVRNTDLAVSPSNNRLTYNFSTSYQWTINKRMQAALIAEPTYQHGLLSTPFHRVFFADSAGTFVETLPLDRFKLPLAFRVNYFLGNSFTFRFYYRYYWDSWGINAHTVNLEAPVKLSRVFTLYPYGRYHTQTAADYFQPFAEHSFGARYFTSDFDLSDLYSYRYGLGLRINPAQAAFKWGTRKTMEVKALDLRFSNYQREDGLEATMFSINSRFIIY